MWCICDSNHIMGSLVVCNGHKHSENSLEWGTEPQTCSTGCDVGEVWSIVKAGRCQQPSSLDLQNTVADCGLWWSVYVAVCCCGICFCIYCMLPVCKQINRKLKCITSCMWRDFYSQRRTTWLLKCLSCRLTCMHSLHFTLKHTHIKWQNVL